MCSGTKYAFCRRPPQTDGRWFRIYRLCRPEDPLVTQEPQIVERLRSLIAPGPKPETPKVSRPSISSTRPRRCPYRPKCRPPHLPGGTKTKWEPLAISNSPCMCINYRLDPFAPETLHPEHAKTSSCKFLEQKSCTLKPYTLLFSQHH